MAMYSYIIPNTWDHSDYFVIMEDLNIATLNQITDH